MRRLILTLIAATLLRPCFAEQRPDWAFFVPTTSATTQPAIDVFDPPDWYPNEHAPMPPIVAKGVRPGPNRSVALLPCALCHLPNGAGHVESASLAGLPREYIIRQFVEIRSGERHVNVGGQNAGQLLTRLKSSYSDEQVRAAAAYFSALTPRPWIEVRETNTVPRSIVDPGTLMRTALAGGAAEPLRSRIVELPQSESGLRMRDAHSGFIAFVPVGSIAKGKRLVTANGPGTLSCTACHGASLNGLGDIPALAGRPPSYLVRQLWNYRSGERRGEMAAPMRAVASALHVDQMLAIAAYLASLHPGND